MQIGVFRGVPGLFVDGLEQSLLPGIGWAVEKEGAMVVELVSAGGLGVDKISVVNAAGVRSPNIGWVVGLLRAGFGFELVNCCAR